MRSKALSKILYNWQVKMICFVLAIFVYFILLYSIQQTRTITLPVEVTLPDTFVAESNVPATVDLVIMGTEDQIYMISPEKIKLSVDFSKVKREGINYAAVNIDTAELDNYLNSTSISIYTRPSQVKVYFSNKTGANE
ncbi:MAG: hypothetical protein HUK24_04755 [Sphaerochaetaceae bacterium]|nr:hypothetical protein [Sphaerochaetaceae bacterium]